LLYPPLLACLEDIARYAFAELLVVWAAMFRKGKSRTIDIGVDVMVPHLVFGPIATYVICNVGPGTQPVGFSAFQKSQLFIGTPVLGEYGYGMLLNDLVGMCCRVMVARRFCLGEA
jgi:hypothetical protein